MNDHDDLIAEAEQWQVIDLLIEFSKFERAARAAVAARRRREQLGTAFQPDRDEAVSDVTRLRR